MEKLSLAEKSKTYKNTMNLILLGKVGVGKSLSGNTILGRQVFETRDSKKCVTTDCKLECSVSDDQIVRVIDTPGMQGSTIPDHEVIQRICMGVGMCKEGLSALVYVMKYNDRFAQDEKRVLQVLKGLFGERFTRDFCIIIMTNGDQFDLNMEDENPKYSFKEWLDKQEELEEFKELLNECQKRVVLFYNKGKDFKKQRDTSRDDFFKMVQSLPMMYTSKLFKLCEGRRKKIIAEYQCLFQKQSIQEEFSLLKQNMFNGLAAIDEISSLDDKVEIRKKNFTLNEQILIMGERAENLTVKLRRYGKEDKSMSEINYSIKNLKTELKYTTKPDDILFKETLKSLIFKVDSMKYDQNSSKMYEGFKFIVKTLAGVSIASAPFIANVIAAGELTITGTALATGAVIAGPAIVVAVAGGAAAYYIWKK